MKSVGIVKKIDDLGRIIIPSGIRKTLKIDAKDPLELFVEGDIIVLKKYQRGCAFCDNIGVMACFKGKSVCVECMNELKKL